MNRKKRYLTSSDHHAAVGDIMAGLVFAFILITFIFAVEFAKATKNKNEALAEYRELQDARAMILDQLKKSMESVGISVIVDPKYGTLQLPENVLFNVGEARLKIAGQKSVTTLGKNLTRLLTACDKNRNDACPDTIPCFESIFIEGHSDRQKLKGKIKQKFISNLNLSAQRAINTYQIMKPHVAQLRNKHQQHLFSVAGYGAERPVGVRPTTWRAQREWHRDNRRITLRFTNCIPKILQEV